MPLIEKENTNNRGVGLELEALQTLITALMKSDGIDEVLNPKLLRKSDP